MALLNEQDATFLRGHFSEKMVNPVKLLFFTQTIACQFCRETSQILEEVAGLSDAITVETYNFVTDKDTADAYGIDKIPAVAVVSETDYGVRFFGIPSGYEFTSLVEAITLVSVGESGLSQDALDKVAQVTEPVHIQVFITPTCPYCPGAVQLAHNLAVANENITADMVESIEFPQLANKYQVMGVPRSVINDDTHVEGALPEPLFVANLLKAVGQMTDADIEAMTQELMAQAQVHHDHDH